MHPFVKFVEQNNSSGEDEAVWVEPVFFIKGKGMGMIFHHWHILMGLNYEGGIKECFSSEHVGNRYYAYLIILN